MLPAPLHLASRATRAAGVAVGLFLALIAAVFVAPAAHAEGSRDLTAQGGNRAYLEWRPSGLLGGIPRRTEMKVYAEAGETIDLGSSAAGLGAGTINYRRPDGTSGTCAAAGRINNRSEEALGPEPVTGTGYTPCTVAVSAGQSGVWEIDLVSPAPANTANPPALAATANWTQSNAVSYVNAWDITVRSAGGTTIPGRAFTNYLSLNMGANNIAFNPELFVQTQDGHRYRIAPNGLDPFVFIFFANNQGFRSSTGASLYRSVQLTTLDAFQNGENVHDPNTPDTANDVTHKIFLATPDPALPASAPSPDGTTWLVVPPSDPPTPSNFSFEGSEGTPGQAGQGAGGVFRFDSSGSGNQAVVIDINRDGTYGNANDRTLAGVVTQGANQVAWDGKDGNGTPVASSATAFQVRVTLHSAEVHFPLFDAENNPNGLILERQIPVPSGYNVFYNDTGLSGGTPPSPADARLGVSSQTGAQAFSGGFGDHKGIDTWTYRTSSPEPLAGGVEVAQADLAITNTDGATTSSVGQPITYTVQVTNSGPSDVAGAQLADTVPGGVSGVSWTCQVTSGTGNCGTASGSGNAVSTALDLDAGAVATITITGTVAPGAPRTLSNTAAVVRPDDVDDPDTTNNSATDATTIDHPPAVTLAGATSVGESTSAERTYTFSVADPDPGGSFSVVGIPACGVGGAYVSGSLTTDASGGSFRCVFADGPASPTVFIQVRDDTSLDGADTRAVTVANVPPSASVANSGPIDEGSSATVTVTASDPAGAGDPLSYEFDCNGDGDYADAQDVGPQAGASASCPYGTEGTHTVNVRVRDGDGGTTTAFTDVVVNNVAPQTAPDSYDVDEDSPLLVNAPGVLGNDSDRPDDPLSTQIVSTTSHGLLSLSADGSFLYTPAPGYSGTDSFTYRACDDEGACSPPETVTITVDPVNDAPDAVDDSATTNEDSDATIDVLDNDSDPEGSPLEVTAFTQPSHGGVSCVNTTGVCTYTPDPDYHGTDSFTYTVSDGDDDATATVNLTVNALNDTPVTQADGYSVPEDGDLDEDAPGVLGNDTDVDGDPLTAEVVDSPSNGTLTLQPDGSFLYSPAADFTGTDSFNDYTIADGQTGSATARVTITVRAQPPPRENLPPAPVGDQAGPPNRPPAPVNDRATTSQGRAVRIAVLDGDSDPDGDKLTVTAWTQPRHGRVTCTAGERCTYRPNAGFAGTERFTYTVSDGRGASRTATVTVRVRAVQTVQAAPERPAPERPDEGGATRGENGQGSPTVPAADDGSPSAVAADEASDRGPLPHTGLALGGLAGLGLALLCAGVAGRRGTARSEE